MKYRRATVGLAALLIAVAAGYLIQQRRGSSDSRTTAPTTLGTGQDSDLGSPTGKSPSRRGKLTGPLAEKESRDWEPGSYEHNLLGDIVEPFNQQELDNLLAQPDKDPYRLADLIHRAAAEKDLRFRYMLKIEGLRTEAAIDLAVAAYDYAVNGKEESLDYILEIHSKQTPGSDSDSIVSLAYIDEWDRTISAYRNHFVGGTDGTGGDAMRAFLLRREYLFRQNYKRYKQKEAEQVVEPDAGNAPE